MTPDELERHHTLRTAVARYDILRTKDTLASHDAGDPPLTRSEALELLALGEVITRKVSYGRQLSVRSARHAGASWTEVGAALDITKQAAWESHTRWLDEQTPR
jgi:hypothetical protein